ncbi:DUF1707 SHOCT-like domain-containing protein [Nocardia caishijiensis]|uniref:Uncharacterized protein DUF1707 n=1 Tax=Nocardia caishijiensis TaxID=184756 RepID=A0ABQ6YUU5_9NOCA|nr:DUF1707 domain-containing protein [Nocardia caishijiensis]KAF0849393.1 uncharacterized protein DUF1707 [Nocardia caishijiensis]
MKTTSPAKTLRARDADRADVCALLDAALADGQLTEAEHGKRTATAMRAETFGALDRLVDDLQVPGELAATPVARGAPRAPRRWWIPVGAVVLAGLLGAGAGLAGRTVGDAVLGPPLPDLTTGNGFAHFLADYRAEYGSTLADELTLYPEYALVERDSGKPGKQDELQYRGDFERWGSPGSRSPGTRSFDLGEVDLAKYARLMSGAPQTTRVPGGWVSHVLVRFPPGGAKDAEPEISIYVENEAEQSGYLKIRLDGEPIAVYPEDS